MKFITAVFAIYVLGLSIAPCSDMFNDCYTADTTVEIAGVHDHPGENEDICTPFCSCTCCCSLILSKVNRPVLAAPRLFNNDRLKTFIKDDHFLSDYSHNIWQPPRLG